MRSPSIRRPLVALVGAGSLSLALAPAASAASATLRAAVTSLPGATEVRTGYDRDLFRHWTDGDGDGCDTRREVLLAEATVRPTVGSGCSLSGGRWSSYVDGATWTDPADLDIDHLVPLAEAWDSGARSWSAGDRERFANDLGDDRSLAAVTDSVNQAKGDQDPSEWEPPLASARCRYAAEWVATKLRWRLSVDPAERSALSGRAAACPATTISWTVAR